MLLQNLENTRYYVSPLSELEKHAHVLRSAAAPAPRKNMCYRVRHCATLPPECAEAVDVSSSEKSTNSLGNNTNSLGTHANSLGSCRKFAVEQRRLTRGCRKFAVKQRGLARELLRIH